MSSLGEIGRCGASNLEYPLTAAPCFSASTGQKHHMLYVFKKLRMCWKRWLSCCGSWDRSWAAREQIRFLVNRFSLFSPLSDRFSSSRISPINFSWSKATLPDNLILIQISLPSLATSLDIFVTDLEIFLFAFWHPLNVVRTCKTHAREAILSSPAHGGVGKAERLHGWDRHGQVSQPQR